MDEAQRGSYPIYFYRFFDVPYEADPNSITGTLVIAADNYYRAWVNDMPYHYEGSWEIPKGFPLEDDTPDHHTLLWPGTNLLVVEVINAAQPWGNPSTNPAGLIYQLHITYRLP